VSKRRCLTRSRKRLSTLIASIIRDLRSFSQFPRGQFILGVRQTLVESSGQCLCIPPTLGGEGAELMAKSATGLAPWQMLNSQLAASRPTTRWSKTRHSSAVKAAMELQDGCCCSHTAVAHVRALPESREIM
jgi:hypothetical protein